MEAASESLRERELDIAREVAHAFVSASTPVEVFRLALARLTPLVRASFSSVFERDPHDSTLLKLTCAHNWPQSSARYLGQLRIRVGRGPTGRAVAEQQPVEVSDVFADPALREWWDPARELGFASLMSLPLRTAGAASGAVTFYFTEPHRFDDDERHLLTLIADQLAVAGARVAATAALRQELDEVRAENERVRAQLGAGAASTRLKDEFLSNISHELRTPLTAIIGYADLLADGQAGELPDRQRVLVSRVDGAAHVLLELINDLLELTQVRLGRVSVNAGPDDAVLLAQRALDAAGPPPPQLQVELVAEAERLPVLVDGDKVVKILCHLLSNAYKFTTHGRVTLSVRAGTDDGARVAEWVVLDTGVGIPADQQDEIFDEFRQVDGSSTRLYGGTGLGLALSRALAQLIDGHITVRSQAGAGSEFRLVVPR
ncbi:MAG TPA: GAF domain-containing sensor histidine kinase [Longimicrobiales bacterium]|nr:GAF domain-containing sensor histidine kinase [Longimicrobiales bacterium]